MANVIFSLSNLFWLIGSIAIWCLLPLFQWQDGTHLLTNPTNQLLLLVINLLLWGIWQFRPSKSAANSDDLTILKQHLNQAFNWIQKHTRHTRFGRLRSRCYIVLGHAHSGRTTLLSQSGCQPLFPFANPQEIQQAHHPLQWWQRNNSLLLMADPVLTQADAAQTQQWQGLLSQMRRWTLRRRRPFDGIVLTLNLNMLHNPADSTALAQQLAQLNTSLTQLSKHPIPLHVVFTHCDFIAGFQEFFGDLDPEEREQYWGICPNLTLGSNPLQDYENTFSDLLSRLNAHLIRRIHQEAHPTKRDLIKDFPVQLERLKSPIKRLLSQLNLAAPLQLQAICFTSNQQTGQYFDYLITDEGQPQDISHTLYNHQQFARQMSYFSKQLFDDLAHYSTTTTGHTQLSQWSVLTTSAIATSLVGFLCYQWYQNAQLTLQTTQLLSQQLQQYSPEGDKLDIWANLKPTQTILNTLQHRKHPWQNFGLKQLKIMETSALEHYHSQLQQQLQPLLQQQLVEQFSRTDQPALTRYRALKAYLMLSNRIPVDTVSLHHWYQQQWQQHGDALDNHLDTLEDLLALPTPNQLIKLDAVNQTRHTLDALALADKAMLLLNETHQHKTLLKINTQKALFKQQQQHIPSHYLASSFAHMSQTVIPKICQKLLHASGNALLKSTQTITQTSCLNQSQAAFANTYAQTWLDLLNTLELESATSIDSLQALLNNLSAPQGDLSKILSFINKQLAVVAQHPGLSEQHQQQLQQLSQTQQYLSSNNSNQAMQQLSQALAAISQAADPEQAAYQFFIKPLKHPEQPNLLALADQSLKDTPTRLRNWQTQLLNDAHQQLRQLSRDYLNSVWHETVYAVYNTKIAQRYPLIKAAQQDISLTDFQAFFATDGILHTYFQEFIAPMVDQSQPMHWHWKPQAAQLGLSDRLLTLFMQGSLIEKMYFHHGNQPLVEFSLIPVGMQSNIKQLTLNLGGQKITLKPGDEQISQLRWPSRGDTNVNLQIMNTIGQQRMTQVNSDWAWFKLLDHARLQPTQNGKRFQLTFSVDDYKAKFELIADRAINPFIPDIITTFSCPESLT